MDGNTSQPTGGGAALSKQERLREFENKALPDNTFQSAKNAFRNFYAERHDDLQSAEKAFRNLVVLLLRNQAFPEPKVSSRLKNRDECINKFERKYRDEAEQSGKSYRIADHITDLIGIRVVCIYESNINEAKKILTDALDVIDVTDKTKEIEEDYKQFGYKGVHLDIRLDKNRASLPEYSAIAPYQFEVQIRTIVQDAWSEVDHKLKYKKRTTTELQRAIHALAALFEVADKNFEQIKDRTDTLEDQARKDAEKSKIVDGPLNSFNFVPTVRTKFPGYEFYESYVDGFVDEIVKYDSDATVLRLSKALHDNFDQVEDYRKYMLQIGNYMNPFTILRHVLYASNKVLYEPMLYAGPRKNFDRWLKTGSVFP